MKSSNLLSSPPETPAVCVCVRNPCTLIRVYAGQPTPSPQPRTILAVLCVSMVTDGGPILRAEMLI